MKTAVIALSALMMGWVALSGAVAQFHPVLWSEDFEDYAPGELTPQDDTWSISWWRTPEPIVFISQAALWTDYSPVLTIQKPADVSADHRGYAHKDITGLIDTDSQLLTIEFDLYHRHAAATYVGNMHEFMASAGGVNVLGLYLCDAHQEEYSQWLNGEAVPGVWSPWSWRHYRFDIDFSAGEVALTINYEEAPRITAPVNGNFSPGDIDTLTFGAGMYYRAGRTGSTSVNNVVISDGRDWFCPAGDVDGDCFVDLADFAVLAGNWQVVGREPNDVTEPNAP